jgi:hypothetical protein
MGYYRDFSSQLQYNKGLAGLEGVGFGLPALDSLFLLQPQPEQARQNEGVVILLQMTLYNRPYWK